MSVLKYPARCETQPSLCFVTASGLTFVNKLHSIKSPIVLQSRHVYNRERKYVRKCAR